MTSPSTGAITGESVTVQTVLGPIPVSKLGMTLTHEHLLNDLSEAFHGGTQPFSSRIVDVPVSPATSWLLREDPYASRDNCSMSIEDLPIVAEELELFTVAGGRTLVDNTTGTGRRPAALVELSRRTGLNLVMGGGWCLSHGQEHTLTAADVDRLAEELITEIRDGVEVPGQEPIKVGAIGEIGVGLNFTEAERVTLQAASIAQHETGLPMLIHLPGWQRRAHEALDVVEKLGVDLGSVVLCHMDPSGKDIVYQREVAARGAWLEFDMISMPFNFPGEGQSPSVEDTVAAVTGLLADGHGDRLLLSHDVFLKGMWTRNGGNGYAYVPTAFLPRLVTAGVDKSVAAALLTDNPAALFIRAAQHSV